MMKFEEPALPKDWEGTKEPNDSSGAALGACPAALGALLEGAGDDPERRVARLGGQLARLDALNVAGMLAAATEGGGAHLARRLDDSLAHAAALHQRLRRATQLAQGAPDAVHARSGAARADANARALLRELAQITDWLDAPALRDLDALPEIPLNTEEGRARALGACDALQRALRGAAEMPAARRRLGAVRERLRRLARARDALAAALARHVNNLLIHLGNEAGAAGPPSAAPRHHAELLPLAPLMRRLKEMDARSFDALAKVYAASWARVYERSVRGACEAARAQLAAAPAADDAAADRLLDAVLTLVETLCDAEQDFCTQFFLLDVDVKTGAEGSDADGEGGGAGDARGGAESRRYMQALFPALEPALLALTQAVEKHDQYGAFVVVACVGRRVVGAAGEGGGAARWARAALAGAAVAGKRQADRCVAERVAALPEACRAAARRARAGVLPCVRDLEALAERCERIFAGGRRADLERWYLTLAEALLAGIAAAPGGGRTPRAVLLLENYHALGGVLAALRVPALDAARRDCKARYADALRAYVTQYFGRPLEKLTLFFEGVSEAVAMGVREEEVCYRAAFSKHELKRVLALYPAHEVRKSLHRLYRTVEKHLSEDSGLLQVVWRAMQEEFIAQHRALQARIAACYPAAGLALPLTTQHILDAFSDIAREH